MRDQTTDFLLDDFISVYEIVAELKLALKEGRLPPTLTRPGKASSATGAELANRVAARIAGLMEAQAKRVREHGTEEQRRQQGRALYAIAALIDEVFILELSWPGRETWLDVLLEYRLFRTRVAGQRFFDLVDQIVIQGGHHASQADLAAVYLLALRLGFQGKYRGASGERRLDDLRQHLLKQVEPPRPEGPPNGVEEQLFPQAYSFRLAGKDRRLAPLRPWLRAGVMSLVAYLLLSSVVWLALLQPFLNRHGGG